MTGSNDPRRVRLSFGIYRALLLVYPRAFRRQYGADMAYVFRDTCREAYRQRGGRGLIPLWGRAILDLSANVPKEVVMTLPLRKRPAKSCKPVQVCSSCNNEVAPEWRKCVYCGELLIPATTHDAPASGPWQGQTGRNAVAKAVQLPWTHKR